MPYLTLEKENKLLRRNIKELQGQLQEAYIRIKKLNEELNFEKASHHPEQNFSTASGWAMTSENPDASFIEKNEDDK